MSPRTISTRSGAEPPPRGGEGCSVMAAPGVKALQVAGPTGSSLPPPPRPCKAAAPMPASPAPRGYFGIGVEGVSKPMNLGALLRTAHAFGAAFAFAVAPDLRYREARRSDTSATPEHLPFYTFSGPTALMLPRGCALVGVELLDEASALPSFRHPQQAAYVLGPERGSLSAELVALCDFVVRIPTRFCVNLSVAGALVMYD